MATLNAEGFYLTSLTFIVICLVFITSKGQVVKAENIAATAPDIPLIKGDEFYLFINEDNYFFKC